MENQLFTTLKLNRLCKNVNFSKIHLNEIMGQIISIREGEVLFREGDSADSIFLIVSGEINIIKKKLLGRTKSYIYGENTFLGQEDFLEEMSRTSIAVALRDSYLVSLSKDEVDRLVAQDGMIAENLKEPIFEFEEDNINREIEEPEEREYENEEESEPDIEPKSEYQIELQPKINSEFEQSITDVKEVKKLEKGVETISRKISSENETEFDVKNSPKAETKEIDIINARDILTTFDHDFLSGLIIEEEPIPIPKTVPKEKQASPWDVTPDFSDSDLMNFIEPEKKSENEFESKTKTTIAQSTEPGNEDIDFSSLDEEFNKHLLHAEKFKIPEDELLEEQKITRESENGEEITKEDYESYLDEELFKLLDIETPAKNELSNPKEISISDLENEEIFKGLNFAEDSDEESVQGSKMKSEDELNNALFDLLNETDDSTKKINATSEMDFTDFDFEEPEMRFDDIPEDIPNPIEPEPEIPEVDIPNPIEPEIEIPEKEIPTPPKPELPVNKGPRQSYAESASQIKSVISEESSSSSDLSISAKSSSKSDAQFKEDQVGENSLSVAAAPKSLSNSDYQLITDQGNENDLLTPSSSRAASSLSEVSSPGATTDSLDSNQLKKIIAASELVNSQVKIDDVLQSIVDVGIDLTNCDRGTLYIVDKAKNEIWSKIAIGSETKEIRLKIGEGLAGHVALTGVTLNIKDVQSDKRFNPENDIESGYTTKNMICFSIKNREKKIIGVLQLINSKTGAFTKLDEEFLEAISIQSAIAIQNAEMVEKLLQAERIQSLGKMTNFLIQDIKKPILVSKRYTEHLKNKELPDEVTKLIDMILEQLNQVADIVTTTSSYSDGTTILRTINLSLNNTLTDYYGRIEMYVKGKGCRIINELDKDVTIKLDMKEFYQCYMHIIKNACDAMPEGGIVEISTKKEGKTVKIFFKDNGIGIDDNLLEKIFDPFSSFGKKEGTGLGLSITRKVVEAHNGKLEVFSKIGEGSTFVITLPIVLSL